MGLSGGQIAGIVVGSTLGAIVVFCLFGRILQACGYTLRARSLGRAVIHHKLDGANTTRTRVAAHRGGSVNGHENCLPTFLAAVRAGAGVLELDVCVSADGVPIVAHDELLARVVDPAWLKAHPDLKRVDQLRAANPHELPPLARRIQLHFRTAKASHFDAAVGAFTAHEFNATTDAASTTRVSIPSVADAAAVIEEVAEGGPKIAVENPPRAHVPRLCTLQELFDVCPPEVILHIDVKQRSDALVHAVVALVHAYGRGASTVLGAGNPENSKILCEMYERGDRGQLPPPEVMLPYPSSSTTGAGANGAAAADKTAPLLPSTLGVKAATHAATGTTLPSGAPFLRFAGAKAVAGTVLGYKLGLLPFSRLDFDVFSIPYPTSYMKGLFKAFGLPRPVLWAFDWLMTPALLQYLQRRGIAVYAWVLNEEGEFAEAAKVCMDGVMTDDVVALAAYCAANPQRQEPVS